MLSLVRRAGDGFKAFCGEAANGFTEVEGFAAGAGFAGHAYPVFGEQALLHIAVQGAARDREDATGLCRAAELGGYLRNGRCAPADDFVELFFFPIDTGVFAGFVNEEAVHLVPGEQGPGRAHRNLEMPGGGF